MPALRLASYLLLFGVTVAIARESPMGNGGKGKKTLYGGFVACANTPDDSIAFSTEIEHVLFRLNSVHNKYKVVRIKIKNNCDRDLLLDIATDKLELQHRDGQVSGLFNIAQEDPDLWNNLDPDLRRNLLYPARVEKGEEENVFVFVTQERPLGIPRGFRYTLRTLGPSVDIRDLTPVARR
jgi:hypothetical protein